jgi:hypothetical protein
MVVVAVGCCIVMVRKDWDVVMVVVVVWMLYCDGQERWNAQA